MQRRGLVIIALIVILVFGALFVFWQQQQGNVQVAQALEQNTTPLSRGKIAARVTGAGNIYAPLQTNLNFQLTGVPITKINVKIGDKVKANTVLAQVDDYDLQFQLRTATASLTTAQARLAQLKAPPEPLDVASAKAKVASAQAAYDAAVARYALVPEQLIVAKTQLDRTQIALQTAQNAYNAIAWRGDVGMTSQATTLQQATLDYQSALANYKLTASGINDTATKSAAQTLAQAQADYARLTDPPTAEEIAISQAAVDSAQTAVDLAKRRLDQARIIAPFDGTVAAINYVPGQIAVTGGNQPPVITLVNLDTLQIQLSFSEIDITRIKMGQDVSLTFDALSRKTLPGKILSISPIGVMTQGVVNYVVTVTLANPDSAVLPGMTAEAVITTESRDNVWRVLSKAVKTQGKASTITVLRNGQQITLIAKTGISDDKNTEIISATTTDGAAFTLNDGEIVVINPVPVTTPTKPADIPIKIK